MDFSALIFPNGTWEDVVDRARRAEELGFRGLWVDDHIVNPARPGQRWYDAWTALAGLAAATSRIRLGPLVSNVVLRHPAMLARQALSVEAMSGGRLQLGIGAGYAASDHAAVDVPVWSPAERSARFREAVSLLDRLLRGELRPAPQRRLPVCVAAHAPSSLRLAAEYGDMWSSFGGFGSTSSEVIELTRRRGAILDAHCAEIGRDPASVRRVALAGSPATTADPIWSSVAAFEHWVGRWTEIGIDELALYFPPELLWRRELVDERVLERLRELLLVA